MKYIMKLNPKYFEYMKNGTKRVEVRLNDEKRRCIQIGDEIIFQKEPELIYDLIQQGVLIQMNYGSIVGQYGKKAQFISEKLLENNLSFRDYNQE